jgi:type II secretory pathway pseudopilin PulG
VVLLLVAAAIVAILPVIVARSRRVQVMRADLSEVLSACRAQYAAARSAADTAAADLWQPPLHGTRRPQDPTCGPYRRRNMLAGSRP